MAIKTDAELVNEAMQSEYRNYPDRRLETLESSVTPIESGGWLVFVIYTFHDEHIGQRTRWIVRPIGFAAAGASGEA